VICNVAPDVEVIVAEVEVTVGYNVSRESIACDWDVVCESDVSEVEMGVARMQTISCFL
jgi:hypothetical protein